MRIKTVPRQMLIRRKTQVVPVESENFHEKYEDSEDSSISDEDEFSKYSPEVQTSSDKCKAQPLLRSLLTRPDTAGPSCRKHSLDCESRTDDLVFNDNNNNSIQSNANLIGTCPGAGPSGYLDTSEDSVSRSPIHEEVALQAMNLCTREQPDEPPTRIRLDSSSPEDRVKETFLYKMMTDPSFLESVQRSKQSQRHVCQFCKQEFSNLDQLSNHLDVKRDEANQVVCCACKKTFAKKRYLRYHQRCHSERTKFSCDICTKKYTRLDNLSRHNAFHVNPDKFSCTSCEKTFARKDLLNKHQRCHDNKYRFFCETCRKYFKGPLTLENHKKIVHAVN